MTLGEARRAIRDLLNPRSPADAAAAYYAFYYAEERTSLVSYPEGESSAAGYVCFSMTGLDLFRPLVTMRLPLLDDQISVNLTASREMISSSFPMGQDVILYAPSQYEPLLTAMFDIDQRQRLRLLVLDRGRFRPVVNVFVLRSEGYDGNPRFIIKQDNAGRLGTGDDVVASSGINWQTPEFAEVYVHTKASHRRRGLGQSVLAACVRHVLDNGQIPLYVAEDSNISSLQLAESVGFVALGTILDWLEGRLSAD